MREAGQKPRALEPGRIIRHRRDCRQRQRVLALLGVDIPQGEPRAIERRLPGQRGAEVADRGRRRLGQQPLDERFEHGDRRVLLFDVGRGGRGRRSHLARDPLERREQFRERAALRDVGADAPGVEGDAARAHHHGVALHLQRSDDHLRCADELADADHGGIGEHGRRRHLQSLERLLPLGAGDGAGAERVEVVGQEDGGSLGQPEEAPFARDILERHDQDPRRRRLRLGSETRPLRLHL